MIIGFMKMFVCLKNYIDLYVKLKLFFELGCAEEKGTKGERCDWWVKLDWVRNFEEGGADGLDKIDGVCCTRICGVLLFF